MVMRVPQQDGKEPAKSKPAPPLSSNAVRSSETDGAASVLFNLQQTHGNRYVQRMLSRSEGNGQGIAIPDMAATGAESTEAEAAEDVRMSSRDEAVFSNPREESVAQTGTKAVNVDLRPHNAPDSALRALAPIYGAGKTPFFDLNGNLGTFEVAPANAAITGRQLETIQQRFGDQGVSQAVHGLALTRGDAFAASALRHAPTAKQLMAPQAANTANVTGNDTNEPLLGAALSDLPTSTQKGGKPSVRTAGREVARVLSHTAGRRLPASVRSKLAALTGDHLGDVRIHTDCAANRAANLLGARAFTVGRSIYFAADEYRPQSNGGIRLLAHEVAHAVQQRGAAMPPLQSLPVSDASDLEETEAERFAEAATRPQMGRLSLVQVARAARIQRAISFGHSADAFTKNTLGVGESAAGFQIRPDALPLFEWNTDITISGNVGDAFGNWEVGPHQVVRSFQNNVYWGTGANRTRRLLTCTNFPVRDATAVGNTWYHDSLASATFGANGDVRHTRIEDSPQSPVHPWTNPIVGRVGDTGSYNYGAAFVAYISARDTALGTGAAAFRAIGNVYWNVASTGTFDTTNPLGSRVTAAGGTVNRSGVISGASAEFPSLHGGTTGNSTFTTTDT
jgi:uncharacterized protein DUF4157